MNEPPTVPGSVYEDVERNGGLLDDVRDTAGRRTRRYWIDVRPA